MGKFIHSTNKKSDFLLPPEYHVCTLLSTTALRSYFLCTIKCYPSIFSKLLCVPVARALIELAAASLPKVCHGTELTHDWATSVPPAHQPLQRCVRVFFIHELLSIQIKKKQYRQCHHRGTLAVKKKEKKREAW